MGETISTTEQPFSEQLAFVETLRSKTDEMLDIYRMKQSPYEYVMDFKKVFIENNDKMGQYVKTMKQMKNMDHKNIAKIFDCEAIEETQMCIKHKNIHTYCSYYNFTLEEGISKKKMLDSIFPESQLLYIMGCLVDASLYLKKYGIAVGQFRPFNVYISPEGYVKIYLLDVEQENKHSCYYKVLSQRQRIDTYILSPQQLHGINNLVYEMNYDMFKADLFAITMLIMELITFDKSKFYYVLGENKDIQLKMGRLEFDISTISKNYSFEFANLMKMCLHPDANRRFSLQEAANKIDEIKKNSKNISYCIRLQEDQEKSKRSSHKKENITSMRGQHILSGIQKKLCPSPIVTLSSTSSSFKLDSKTASNRNSQAINYIKF